MTGVTLVLSENWRFCWGPNSRDPWEANNGKRDGEWQSELRNIEWMGNIIYSLKIETKKIKFDRTLHEYHKLYKCTPPRGEI